MTRYSRKKGNNAPYSKIGKRIKTKNREKDLDEVHEDIKNEAKGLKRERDIDLPGEGQFVCVQCSRYFIDNNALLDHQKSKQHKRRLKKLLDEPYTQEEAEKAAGMGSYHYEHNKKMKIE